MYQSTHASVGQNQGRLPYAQRAGSSPTPGVNCVVSMRSVNSDYASPTGWDGPPPSARRSPRLGISLTEVLIAMGILTVGLLGVASIFPVASFYMQKGDVANNGSAIAQAAFNEGLARGSFDPASWYAMTRTDFEPPAYSLSSDGPVNSFSRPVLASIGNARAIWPTAALCQRVGHVYVIDPAGAATISNDQLPSLYNQGARSFPASAAVINLKGDYYSPAWDQWLATPPARTIWPVRRVTFRQPKTGPMPASPTFFDRTQSFNEAAANDLFSSGDDLAIEVPPQSDRPSTQLLAKSDLNSDGAADALARQSKGDYSWLATVVPSDPWNLANATCEVSVVVLFKRVLDGSEDGMTQESMMDAAATERMVKASVVSTGLSGGELLLNSVTDGITESAFQGLKVGRWIMLCGPSPNSTSEQPRFVARWYRVLAIEQQDAGRRVSLRGPQWPWQPQTGTNALSNNLCAGIIPSAVAVHSKSIRLDSNSSWSIQ